jgi:hypothetical protein
MEEAEPDDFYLNSQTEKTNKSKIGFGKHLVGG